MLGWPLCVPPRRRLVISGMHTNHPRVLMTPAYPHNDHFHNEHWGSSMWMKGRGGDRDPTIKNNWYVRSPVGNR